MSETMWVATGQACDREQRKGLHCWHRKTSLDTSGKFEEIVETCCWCGTEIHYRGPSFEGHGPFLKENT